MAIETGVGTDFILVQADWPVAQARELLEHLEAGRVIVFRQEGEQEYWYLFWRQEVMQLLDLKPPTMPVKEALDLHEWSRTETVDSSDLPTFPDQRYVVLEDGRVQGFLEPELAESFGPRAGARRGETKAPAPGPAPAPTPLKRALVAEFPEAVVVEQPATLLIQLLAEVERAVGPSFLVEVPAGAAIDILVQPRRGFAIEGPDSQRLEVNADEPEQEVLFRLRPTEVGKGEIRVLAFYQGQRLGRITLEPTVLAAQVSSADGRRRQEASLAQVHPSCPDLSLLIFERKENGRIVLELRLNGRDPSLGLNFKRFGPLTLETDPGQHFGQFFKDVEDLPIGSAVQRKEAAEKLKALGSHLFDTLFPPEMQQVLWSVRDRITSVQVQSEEPWIPWELCRLCGEQDGTYVEGPFLSEAYELTRWIQDLPLQPRLAMRNLALVVPGDSGLAYAEDERAFFLSLGQGNGRRVQEVPAKFLELREALASGSYDGWHFTGHGGSEAGNQDRSVMKLQDGRTFTPQELSGRLRNLGRARPLVFLNACQLGQGGMALTGVGGWANRFLQAGAAAFVGAFWSVSDEPAFTFAKAFYERLLGGAPIGQAAREARVAIQQSSDPTTWLAYTVFADPFARVE